METWWVEWDDIWKSVDKKKAVALGLVPVVKLTDVEAELEYWQKREKMLNDCASRVLLEKQALERRVALAEAILRDLDGHPRADYPVSLDKRIKAWLAAEPPKED